MQGDFSRDSFDLQRVFSRVLSQQGRVALDADWNEMQAIQLRLLRGLAADLIGPHGGHGFRVDQVGENDFGVQPGRYYVDGWLCENPAAVSYAGGLARPAQPFWPVDEGEALLKGTRYLVYLDVWERHLAWPETDGALELQRRTPTAVREMALDGLDTASRAQLTWQLRVLDQWVDKSGKSVPLPNLGTEADWRKWIDENWPALVNLWQPMARGQLVASTEPPSSAGALAPCAVSPEARYRGVENQLYRVEVHQGGLAGEGASFKWSRENASVLLPVASISGSEVKLSAWWRDARLGIAEGDWVEVFDDADSLRRQPRPLSRVKVVDRDTQSLVLESAPTLQEADPGRHPVVRRWDQRLDPKATADGIPIDESLTSGLVLEDGIKIRFQAGPKNAPHRYRTGDHWLIPARTAIADIVWPRSFGAQVVAAPRALPPHGVEHHYAPLAVIDVGNAKSFPLGREIAALTGR